MTEHLAVVTGASGGIGRAIATRLGRDGHAVVVHWATNWTAARAVTEEIRQSSSKAWIARANLGTADGIGSLRDRVAEVLKQHPGMELRVLVNNASLMLGPRYGEISADTFDQYVALNIRAPLLLTQALTPMMSPGGSVVNISSAAAHFASPGDILYAVTKSALEALTRHAAPALAQAHLRINTVIPGFTDNGHPAFQDPAIRAHMESFAVMGGVAEPAQVAAAVSFLASDASARTTGSVVDVSGGSTIAARPQDSSSLSLRAFAHDPATDGASAGN